MLMRLMLAGLLSAIVAWPSAVSALSEDECDEIDIRFKGLPGTASARCGISGIGGGGDQGSGRDEYIQVIGSSFVFLVSHASAGHRTYLQRLTVKEMLEDSPVFKTMNWGDEAENGEFSIRRFSGTFSDGIKTACFGFARYSGHVSRTTGYRHLINGFYCDMDESPPADGRIGQVLGSLEYSF